MMKKNNKNRKIILRKNCFKGFTLIEIIVTIAIFSLIFGVASGMFASAIRTQRKSLVSQELLSQTSYVMEYMSRHLRMAKNYNVASANCTGSGYNYEITRGGQGIKFANYEDPSCCWEFYLEDNRLNRAITGCGSDVTGPLTSANFIVDKFSIFLIDSEAGAGSQPRLTLLLKIRGGGEKLEEQSVIEVQTTISQRALNESDSGGGSGGGTWTCGNIFTDDRDSQQYGTIEINGRCWMSEAMNIGTFFPDPLSNPQGDTCDPADPVGDIEKYCYEDNEANCDSYGGLYQWPQAVCGDYSPPTKGICPDGWHIPTDGEWHELELALWDNSPDCLPDRRWPDLYGCNPAGKELKIGGNTFFDWPLSGCWDSSPGEWYEPGYGFLWSSSVNNAYRFVWQDEDRLGRDLSEITCAMPVRCIKD